MRYVLLTMESPRLRRLIKVSRPDVVRPADDGRYKALADEGAFYSKTCK